MEPLKILENLIIHLFKSYTSVYFICILVFYLYIYSYLFKKSQNIVGALLTSFGVGFVISFLSTLLSMYFYVDYKVLWIVPILLILNKVDKKYVCLSYSGAILIFFSYLFPGYLYIDTRGLIGMVGILHLAEAVLVLTVNAKNKASDYELLGLWPLSLSYLFVTNMRLKEILDENIHTVLLLSQNASLYGILFSVVYFFVFYNIYFLNEKKIGKRVMRTSGELFIYALTLIFIYVVSYRLKYMLYIGAVLMPVLHEILILIEEKCHYE